MLSRLEPLHQRHIRRRPGEGKLRGVDVRVDEARAQELARPQRHSLPQSTGGCCIVHSCRLRLEARDAPRGVDRHGRPLVHGHGTAPILLGGGG